MKRVVSALVLGAVAIAAVLAAPPLLVVPLVAAFAVQGTREMAALLAAQGAQARVAILAAGSIAIIAGAGLGGSPGLSAGLVLALALHAWDRVRTGEVQGASMSLAAGALALLVPTWSLAHIVLYFDLEKGRVALLFVLAVVWACDTAAYYGGTAFGKARLAPAISPNKTVEGSVFGLAAGLATGFAFWLWSSVEWSLGFSLASGVSLAALGQLGDLMESLLKRSAGVKDSGTLIPGHGGVMDRVDALLLSVPAFYYFLLIHRSAAP